MFCFQPLFFSVVTFLPRRHFRPADKGLAVYSTASFKFSTSTLKIFAFIYFVFLFFSFSSTLSDIHNQFLYVSLHAGIMCVVLKRLVAVAHLRTWVVTSCKEKILRSLNALTPANRHQQVIKTSRLSENKNGGRRWVAGISYLNAGSISFSLYFSHFLMIVVFKLFLIRKFTEVTKPTRITFTIVIPWNKRWLRRCRYKKLNETMR